MTDGKTCMCVKFEIPGPPEGQGRPRFTTFGGHVRAFDPAKSRSRKADIATYAKDAAVKQGWNCAAKEPLYVYITANFAVPKSKSKKFREAALAGLEQPAKKPDIDNIVKQVLDALNGVLFADDTQVCALSIEKRYTDMPSTFVEIGLMCGYPED